MGIQRLRDETVANQYVGVGETTKHFELWAIFCHRIPFSKCFMDMHYMHISAYISVLMRHDDARSTSWGAKISKDPQVVQAMSCEHPDLQTNPGLGRVADRTGRTSRRQSLGGQEWRRDQDGQYAAASFCTGTFEVFPRRLGVDCHEWFVVGTGPFFGSTAVSKGKLDNFWQLRCELNASLWFSECNYFNPQFGSSFESRQRRVCKN